MHCILNAIKFSMYTDDENYINSLMTTHLKRYMNIHRSSYIHMYIYLSIYIYVYIYM